MRPRKEGGFNPIEELVETISILHKCESQLFANTFPTCHIAFAPSLPADFSSCVPALKVAISQRDAWDFCKTLAEVNTAFGGLVSSPIRTLDLRAAQDRILQDSYARLVQPNARLLTNYAPFSNCVYGEILPPFVDRIIELTQLTSSSLFLDLGSGVGSVVAQVSLRTGCTSVGIELVPHVAALAQDLMAQILFRCHMWGVPCSQIKVEEGDMLGSQSIAELIPRADAIFVNNLAFKPDRSFFFYALLAIDSHHFGPSQRKNQNSTENYQGRRQDYIPPAIGSHVIKETQSKNCKIRILSPCTSSHNSRETPTFRHADLSNIHMVKIMSLGQILGGCSTSILWI